MTPTARNWLGFQWNITALLLVASVAIELTGTLDLRSNIFAQEKNAESEEETLRQNLRSLRSIMAKVEGELTDSRQKMFELAIASENDVLRDREMRPMVFLEVTINPEGRVRIQRGKVVPKLRVGKESIGVVRINNESRSQQSLSVRTIYAGSQENPFDVGLVEDDALASQLIGLPVEYRLVRIRSAVIGKHELTIAFEAGQGTQDIGFRGEVPVLFQVTADERVQAVDGK